LNLALLFAPALFAADTASVFERPPELERDVQFWIRVYTEVGTDQGLLHDDWNLGVVYEVLSFDHDLAPRQRATIIDGKKKHYRELLGRFAAGDTLNLSEDEQRILAAFGEHASAPVFKAAMDGVRFQLGQANRFREGLMRAGIWESHIARTLSQRGVPGEIAALPHVESSFNPTAYSKVGAAGLWQFMPSTARRYMRVDSLVDERMDPFTATEAAANLMLYNYRLLGTWPLAITAYNHGPGGLLKAQTDLGTSSIATIVRRYSGATFGFASRNFYVAFLAALEVDRNAEKYFGAIPKQPDAESTTVELPDYVPMSALIAAFNIDLGAMRALNPSLRPPIWNGARFVPRGYALRLPGTVGDKQIEAALLRVPATQRYLAQRNDGTYRARRGDTASSIAQRNGVAVDGLLAANGWERSVAIKRGQVVRLPLPTSRAGTPAAPVLASAATPLTTEQSAVAPPAAAVSPAPPPTRAASTPASPPTAAVRQPAPIVVPPAPAKLPPVAAPKPPSAAAVAAAVLPPRPTLAKNVAHAPEAVAPSSDDASVFPDGVPNASADPADYAVGRDLAIVVQAEETLGHYADWSGININRLRALNKMRRGASVSMGRKFKLDIAVADIPHFEAVRREYHKNLQDEYFATHRISGTENYAVKKGESLWTIRQARPELPVWLIRQYNPRLDFADLHPGSSITLPKVAAANRE
jgi:membrane-bound lytic murein transglycosylase D